MNNNEKKHELVRPARLRWRTRTLLAILLLFGPICGAIVGLLENGQRLKELSSEKAEAYEVIAILLFAGVMPYVAVATIFRQIPRYHLLPATLVLSTLLGLSLVPVYETFSYQWWRPRGQATFYLLLCTAALLSLISSIMGMVVGFWVRYRSASRGKR